MLYYYFKQLNASLYCSVEPKKRFIFYFLSILICFILLCIAELYIKSSLKSIDQNQLFALYHNFKHICS